MVTRFQIIPPEEDLKDFVCYFWFFEGKASASSPYEHKMIPNGRSEVIQQVQGHAAIGFEDRFVRLPDEPILMGQSNQLTTFRLAEDFRIFGICLYPYTIPFLSGTAAEHYTNNYMPLSGKLGIDPNALLPDAEVDILDKERITMAAGFLKGTLSRLQGEHAQTFKMIRDLLQYRAGKINDFVAENQINLRSFQRKCKHYTGYTPKQLMRIARIHAAMFEKKVSSLTTLAYKLDYYDQAHFANDFKLLTGLTPRQYFSQTPEDLAWQNQGKKVGL